MGIIKNTLAMKSFALAAVAGAAAAVETPAFEFFNYLAKFNKAYSTDTEFKLRFERFAATHAHIEAHNNQENNSYTADHNQLSDWTYAEYKAIMGYRKGESVSRKTQVFNETNADSIDWRTMGGVTPVKDQGACGSCWAFSSTGSIEGAHFAATGELLSFSEQQLVDCAYNYYEDGHMAELESVYPYVSGTTYHRTDCQYNASSATAVTVSDYAAVTAESVSQMKAALQQQPLAVAIEADQYVFQAYSSGIFDSSSCGTNLDHAVLLVGYGSENGQEYWIMKNSWNTTWGESGYMRMAITGDGAGICGVQLDPEFPTTNCGTKQLDLLDRFVTKALG